MTKDFDGWNTSKKTIHAGSPPFYHEREVWWCDVGINVGFEQDGDDAHYRRPIVILKSFGKETCCALPITTSKIQHPLRFPLGKVDGKEARALLSQIKTISTRRLVHKIELLNTDTFITLRKTVRNMF